MTWGEVLALGAIIVVGFAIRNWLNRIQEHNEDLQRSVDGLGEEVGALRKDYLNLQRQLAQIHDDMLNQWKFQYRQQGWTEGEIAALAELFDEMQAAHPLAPVVTEWEKRHPEVAKKFGLHKTKSRDDHK